MTTKFSFLTVLAIMTTMVMYLAGCGGDDPTEPEPPAPTVLRVTVTSSVDGTAVDNSNVVLYGAESRAAVRRNLTDSDGTVYFRCEAGNYYVCVSAQGFESVPVENISPIPFFVVAEDTTIQDVSLDILEDAGSAGYVQGFVEPAVNNFLILAESQSSQETYYTVSGPDGFFVLHNLPYGTYALDALKSGYRMDGDVSSSISAQVMVDSVQIPVSEYNGSLLNGSVTFLASENSTVDITLLDPATRAVVPGLTVMSDVSGLDYRIDAIPDGNYLAWASLRNDGYVIDPDWLFKNPGGLDITFATSGTIQLDFSVTDAITLLSPTNPADSTFAFMADAPVPTFRWAAYPSAKEYFIEVRDLNGNVIWGGFEDDGTVNHGFIGAQVASVEYNFDNQSGASVLEPGKIYQWKIWADLGTQQDSFVEQLISSSEDLRGIFQVPGNPPE